MGEGKVLIEPATSLRLLLSDKNSVVVKEYTDGESAKFALPMEISTEVKTLAGKRHFNAKLKQWMYSGITMIVGLIAGWIVIAAIGWVFRGFLGVPAGQDERNSF